MGLGPGELGVAARGLRRSGSLGLVAVATLAIAIAANTALFSVVDAALFKSLPYPDPGGLAQLWESHPGRGELRFGVSTPAFLDWRKQSRSFAEVAAVTTSSANLAGGEAAARVVVARVAGDILGVLGVRPALGRSLAPRDEQPGTDHVLLLGHGLWRSAFGSDPAVLGRSLLIDGSPHQVVGILPPLAFPFEDVQLLAPLVFSESDRERRGARWLVVLGRLDDGATLSEARAELSALAARHENLHPATNEGWTVDVVPLHEARVRETRPILLLLWSAVLAVLLIACANVGQLLLVRALATERERAVRAALGASPWRLLRETLAETSLLAAAGGALGLLLAIPLRRGLVALIAVTLPGANDAAIDTRVVALALSLSLATALLCGLAPLFHVARADVERALRPAARGWVGASRPRLRRGLVVAELGLAVALLMGSGLLLRSLWRLLEVDPGFDARSVLTLRVAPPQVQPAPGQNEDAFVEAYLADRARAARFYEQVLQRLAILPGVLAAAGVNRLPLAGRWWSTGVRLEGAPATGPGDEPSAYGRVATPGYFEALRIVLRGRDFAASDEAGSAAVAIVSESMAQRFWPGADPLGRRFALDDPDAPWMSVVGVAADVRTEGLEQRARPTFYVPLPQARFGFYPDWGMDLVVRVKADPLTLAAAVRAEVRELDPSLAVFALDTLENRLSGAVAQRRVVLRLLAGFAALALLLAALGLYAVIAHSTRLRWRELGVRLALGARPAGLVALVLREALAVSVLGILAGLAVGWAGARLGASLLYATPVLDGPTLAAVVGLMLAVSVLASLLPARWAARVDPVVALRSE